MAVPSWARSRWASIQVLQGIGERPGLCLAYSPSLVGWQVTHLALDGVQLTDVVQGLFGQRALVGHMQVVELAPGVSDQ